MRMPFVSAHYDAVEISLVYISHFLYIQNNYMYDVCMCTTVIKHLCVHLSISCDVCIIMFVNYVRLVLGDEGWLGKPWRFDTKPWVYEKVPIE